VTSTGRRAGLLGGDRRDVVDADPFVVAGGVRGDDPDLNGGLVVGRGRSPTSTGVTSVASFGPVVASATNPAGRFV
jgi:hypothetical protein